jgi:hypothetical protein
VSFDVLFCASISISVTLTSLIISSCSVAVTDEVGPDGVEVDPEPEPPADGPEVGPVVGPIGGIVDVKDVGGVKDAGDKGVTTGAGAGLIPNFLNVGFL